MRRPPCIVCGLRRGHDPETHDRYRHEYRRTKNLLRRTWPRLAGKEKLMEFYARQEPPPAPPSDAGPRLVGWNARVLRGGAVVHVPVFEGSA